MPAELANEWNNRQSGCYPVRWPKKRSENILQYAHASPIGLVLKGVRSLARVDRETSRESTD